MRLTGRDGILQIITGSQEAELSFAGAITGLPTAADYLVVDIGGGSTEFVRGGSHVLSSESVNVGTVRGHQSNPPRTCRRHHGRNTHLARSHATDPSHRAHSVRTRPSGRHRGLSRVWR